MCVSHCHLGVKHTLFDADTANEGNLFDFDIILSKTIIAASYKIKRVK